jgi:hypothetical protein
VLLDEMKSQDTITVSTAGFFCHGAFFENSHGA